MAAIFERILEMSFTAAVVIVVVLFIRLLLRKAPRKYSYALWSVAAFRLVCPVSFKAVFSLFQFTQRVEETQIIQSVTNPVPTVSPGYFDSVPPGTGTPVELDPNYVFTYYPIATPPVLEAPAVTPINWMQVVAIVWLVGLAALLIYGVVSYVRLHRRMSTAVVLEGRVWQSDRVQSPFILGFVRPKIYLPFGLNVDQRRYVLAHENFHLKRLDHIVRPLSFLILAVHWFNPFVWVGYYLMGQDMEMSCDEKVLSGGENAAGYSTTLLSFAANRRFPLPSPLAFGESGIKGRIKNALSWKKPRTWVTILAILVCVVVIVVCAANPREEKSDAYDICSTLHDPDHAAVWYASAADPDNYTPLSDEQKETFVSLLNQIDKREFDWYAETKTELIKPSPVELKERFEDILYDYSPAQAGGCRIALELEKSAIYAVLTYSSDDELYMILIADIGETIETRWYVENAELQGFMASLCGVLPTESPYAMAQAITPTHVEWAELMINGENPIYRSLSGEEISQLTALLNGAAKDDFSTPPKNAAWAFPTERMVALRCGGIEYFLNLGPSPMTIICRDDGVDWKGEDTWFLASDEIKDFIRTLPEFRDLDKGVMEGYLPYVSTQCVYQWSAISMTIPDDSGKNYMIGEYLVAILDKNDNDAGEFFPYPAPWKALGQSEWEQMFAGSAPDVSRCENPRIRRLSGEYALVDLDGTLWILQLTKLDGIGYRVALIYRLAPATETARLAQWQADLTGDGEEDTIAAEGTFVEGKFVAATLSVTGSDGKGLWSDGFSMGSDEVADFYLVEQGGTPAILEWTARESETMLYYSYSIVKLDGTTAGMTHNTLRIGLTDEELVDLDIPYVRDYFSTVDGFLGDSTLLLGGLSGEIVSNKPARPMNHIIPLLEQMRLEALSRVTAGAETLSTFRADLTHDGKREYITLTYREDQWMYYLTVTNEDGDIIWEDTANTAHMGWNGLYLYQRDNQSYLMRWLPYGSTGIFHYHYEVFSLDEDGTELPLVENSFSFDTMYPYGILAIDLDGMRAFEQEVNALLEDTIVLITTDEGTPYYSTEETTLCKLWSAPVKEWEQQQLVLQQELTEREKNTLITMGVDLLHTGETQNLTYLSRNNGGFEATVRGGVMDFYLYWTDTIPPGGTPYILYYREHGKDYLARWWGDYTCRVFHLSADGLELELRKDHLPLDRSEVITALGRAGIDLSTHLPVTAERINTAAVGTSGEHALYQVNFIPVGQSAPLQTCYVILHHRWDNLNGTEPDEWYLMDILSADEFQHRFNTPEMLAQYNNDPYLAAAVETGKAWKPQ